MHAGPRRTVALGRLTQPSLDARTLYNSSPNFSKDCGTECDGGPDTQLTIMPPNKIPGMTTILEDALSRTVTPWPSMHETEVALERS